jgi:hypothetical protein
MILYIYIYIYIYISIYRMHIILCLFMYHLLLNFWPDRAHNHKLSILYYIYNTILYFTTVIIIYNIIISKGVLKNLLDGSDTRF